MARSGSEFRIKIDRLDGGLNLADSPSALEPSETPDCLNVVFDQRGGAMTRAGTSYYGTGPIFASSVIDGMISYNSTHLVWTGGNLYRSSGVTTVTYVTVGSAQGAFTAGNRVAAEIYQNQVFCCDGVNGPYRYTTDAGFYRMGIATPSACTGASANATLSTQGPQPGDYRYSISYRNTAVVEGQVGSACVTITLTNTSTVSLTCIPVAATSLGVASRCVYRSIYSSSTWGGWQRAGVIADNSTTTFLDNVGTATINVSASNVVDASSLPVFTTIKSHKEHLWVDDGTDRTLLRYTDYGVPYISQAENFIPLRQGDLSYITAIGVQDDFVSVFKQDSIWIVDLVTPGTTTSYTWVKSPSNLGIVGPRAFAEWEGGIVFVGMQGGRVTGFHNLAGTAVSQVADKKLRSNKISAKIDSFIYAMPSSYVNKICLVIKNNQLFAAVPGTESATYNNRILWWDANRIATEDPGSWSLWDGIGAEVTCFCIHSGDLLGGSAVATNGRIVKLNDTTVFSDADGEAINSYWYSPELGGEDMDEWEKDWRKMYVYFGYSTTLTANDMVIYDIEGGTGETGNSRTISLANTGSVWGTMVWGQDLWGGAVVNSDVAIDLGSRVCRRLQIKVSNGDTADRAFAIYRVNLIGNLRRFI